MRLILVNYDNNYETEQFTRMFFKGLDIEKVKEVPRDLTGDYICIEKRESSFNINLRCGEKQIKDICNITGDEKEEMQLCLFLYKIYRQVTGTTQPWGVLTGVRPVRLMRNLYAKLGSLDAVKEKFIN